MNVTHPLRWLSCRALPVVGGALLVGPVAFAQKPEPAARLLPARPAEPNPKVSRAAAPEYGTPAQYAYQVPDSIPAPNYANRVTRVTPAPTPTVAPPAEPVKSPGVIGGAVSGVKNLFGGKPAEDAAKPWWPTPEAQGKSQPAVVRQTQMATPEPPPPPPGVYAGPPAYRWYGYGSPTPGANPYAPSGQYPKGSSNWYTQTGATPGAFPIPVNATQQPQPGGVEPPTYAGFSQPSTGTYLAGTRVSSPEPRAPRPEPIAIERAERTVVQSAPRPRFDPEPQMPAGGGTPLTSTAQQQSEQGAFDQPWQPVQGRTPPLAATPSPRSTQPQPAQQPVTDEPAWLPALRSIPAGTITPQPNAPTVSMIRGQAPAEEKLDEVSLIRNACFGRASGVSVTVLGPKRLHVKLVAPTESDARDAAAVVSRLTELTTYTVTFEASVSR